MLVKENIQIRPFDAINSVLQIDENRHLLINRATTELVKILSAATSLEAAHKVFNQSFHQTISMQSFQNLVEEKLGGYQIIREDSVPEKPSLKNAYLKLKIPLLNAQVSHFLSIPLQPFFKPSVFWFSAGAMILFLIGMAIGFESPSLNQVNYMTLMTLIYPTMLIHELGHIAACSKYKLKPGGIGFGFYFILPVMYAEITNIWMGNKEQRIITNLGGIFAEVLYAVILSIVYLISQSPVCLFASLSISIFLLWEFNPFVRFDGYWLLSDLTNTPNLLLKSKQVLSKVMRRSFLHSWRKNNFKVNASRREILLFAYGFMNTFFILLILGYTLISYQTEIIRFPFSIYQIVVKVGQLNLHIRDLNVQLIHILLFYILAIRFLISQFKSLLR
jgi:putative peptide zinc metalloprotease protein